MFIALVTIIHLIAGNLVAGHFAYKFPNFRMDTIFCIFLGIYGGITAAIPFFDKTFFDDHLALAFFASTSWVFASIAAILEISLKPTCLLGLRKRVTLVPGYSYLYSGLFTNRSKMIISNRGGFYEKVKSEYFTYFSKFSFTPYKNYKLIVEDASKTFDYQRAFMQELSTRKVIQDYAHDGLCAYCD